MGKILVIKGADFSAVAVDCVWSQMSLVQGGINIANQGQEGTAFDASHRIRTLSTIFVPEGKTLNLKGLKGRSGSEDALRFSYVWYSAEHSTFPPESEGSPADFVGTDATVGSVETYFMNNVGGGDTLSITNNKGAGYYFAFTFAHQNTAQTPLDVSLYQYLEYSVK